MYRHYKEGETLTPWDNLGTTMGYMLLTGLYIALVAWVYPSMALALLSVTSLILYRIGAPWYSAISLFFIPYVFLPGIEPVYKYVFIALSGLGGWIIIKNLEESGETYKKRNIFPIFGVLTVSLAMAGVVAVNAIRTHHNLMTASFDLGLFDNIFYNISTGNGMLNTMERNNVDQNHFYVHFSPIFYLLSPIYSIFKRAEGLIVIQALTIITGSVGLYLLAKQLLDKSAAALLAICWSIYTPLQGGLYYHFHEVVVGPTILFLIGASIVRGHKLIPWALILILASVKEDYPIICLPAILLFGVWAKRIKLAVGLMGVLVIYFALIKILWIIPNAENWTGRIYGEIGVENVAQLATLVITDPAKILNSMWTGLKLFNILELLVPLGLIALLSPWTYILMAIPLIVLYTPTDTVFSSNFFQYTFNTSPFLFLGTLAVFKKWTPKKQKEVGILLIALGLVTSWNFGMLGGKPFRIGFITITNPVEITNRDAYKELYGILQDIPKHSIVASDDNLSSHISNRKKAYTLKYWDSNTLSSWDDIEKPDYIIQWKHDNRILFEGYRDTFIGNHFKVKKIIGRSYND
jgi:uncharacterized membrane protein